MNESVGQPRKYGWALEKITELGHPPFLGFEAASLKLAALGSRGQIQRVADLPASAPSAQGIALWRRSEGLRKWHTHGPQQSFLIFLSA